MADPTPPEDAPNANIQGQSQALNNGGPSPSPAPAAGLSSLKTPAVPMSTTRPPYIPQFTAATQMILKRMKGESTSLSSALSAASSNVSVTSSIKQATYEDVKRRLVMGMTTSSSMTMQMPISSPTPPPTAPTVPAPSSSRATPAPTPYLSVPSSASGTPRKKAPAMSATTRISGGLTIGTKPLTTKPIPPVKSLAAKAPASESKVIKKTKPLRAAGATASRRKNAKKDDDTSSISSLSEISDDETPTEAATSTQKQPQPHTMTKSGRQVQKPVTYNPADMEANGSRKRTHYGKRTTEQALCKKCSRLYSPASNQMVFCDGCNDGWHQRCHDPWITDDMVRDQNRNWFCSKCQAKREPRQPPSKKQKVEQPPRQPQQPARESWAGKSAQQKRAYLLTLPQPELVALIMHSLELHPDLPIFPSLDGGNNAASPSHHPRSIFASSTTEGLFPRADANSTAQINYNRKAGKNGKQKDGSQENLNPQSTADDLEEEFDPLVALWPKAGMGLYARLPPDIEDDEHLVDEGDFEAFSTIIYEKGKKVMENGMKV
ncbi:hypothetical protein V8F20_011855 [Naviculisporaceae sp. PSN 640]